jgi:NAD(P)-dependent dehydrogenase (short-subunit alcohol dehydrogenase family)
MSTCTTLETAATPAFDSALDTSLDGPLQTAVALITGGGRGIGRMVARALAGAGATVALVARSVDELTETVHQIEAEGGTAAACVADVSDPESLAAALRALKRRVGPFDLLINNAGISGPIGPLWEIDAAAWWTTMDVNLRGVMLSSQLVLPDMVDRCRGRIINITSRAGAHRWPLVSGYSVSKAAVIKLTENLARETARFGVGVFSVHPGLLPIGMSTSVTGTEPTNRYERKVQEWTLGELREGRGADPRDAVDLIVRVASGGADALSGRHISVHDDLDAMLARQAEVRSRDLYVMRPEPLREQDLEVPRYTAPPRRDSTPPRCPSPTTRPAGAPAYHRGIPVAVWLAAMQRRRHVTR